MKVCSECQRCYDDSSVNCSFEDHGTLADERSGDCTLVEGYKIDSQIESDSPVEIFRATHLASEKSVLIRIINADNSSAELRNELQSYVNISNLNLAVIFEFGKLETEEIYIVSEDVEGQTLREFLGETNKFSELHAIKIARQIAETLEQIHNAGLLHRNLNPANIYITNSANDEFKVKLNHPDFGGIIEKKVVKDANGINAKAEIFEYFSPEQFSAKEIDFKSDLYSLAIVFYEMLLGHTPYDLLSPQASKDFIFNEDDVDCLDHDLRSLIAYTLRESLQQRLNLRPRSTNNLVRQLRHLELVATPSEFVEEELANSTEKFVERERFDERENFIRSMQIENFDETFDLPADDFENFDESDEKPLPLIPVAATSPARNLSPPNSYTFKKSHVYIAGTLVMILFGSFFLITFYNWQSNATQTNTGLTEKETKDAEKPNGQEKDDIADSQTIEVDGKENDSSLDVIPREALEREKAESTSLASSKKSPKNNRSENTGQAKSTKKTDNKEQIAENKLFEDTVIIVGDKKSRKDKNSVGKKPSKVFSNVVITY